MSAVAPRIVTDVSDVMRINHEIHSAYGEQGPAKLSRHKAAKPLNLDHAAKPRSHKATCRHSLTGASQRHKAAKLQKTQNVVEFECTIKSAAKASRNTLACMAGHEPRLWCFSSL